MRSLWCVYTSRLATGLCLGLCSFLIGNTGMQAAQAQPAPRFSVLVFSKTEGARHASIEASVAAIRRLGEAHGFSVTATENAALFSDSTIGQYSAVVFLNTSGDVLDASQQAAFEQYIGQGGGFVGIHSAAATEYDWPWYGGLIGAYAENPSAVTEADVLVLDPAHPSTRMLPPRWARTDAWYNFRENPRGDVHVVATISEKSYEGGAMGHDHPIVWAHAYEGGRAWYTGLGHAEQSYRDSLFLEHLRGGIEWAAGAAEGEVGATLAGGFEKVVLDDETMYPMGLDIAPDGRVFYIERDGALKVWDPETEATTMAAFIPVTTKIEDGLLGIALDPDFEENNWLYLYYAPMSEDPNRLSRFTVRGDELDLASEKVLLEVRVQREQCCHSAGELNFGPDGTLYLSTGDNTGGSIPRTDERPGRAYWDAQRSSANTNDLRGKILRIRPEPDGSYSIPEGNLFEEADSLTRPEIFAMGFRNPWRFSIDPKTEWIYYGDVGEGNLFVEGSAPEGVEEFGQIRGPGNFGMPYFVGDNEPYREKNFDTGALGAWPNPQAPVNDSPNNTGLRMLPPAQPAWISYFYMPSEAFPEMGVGALSAAAGPVYYYDEERTGPRGLPPYYDGSLFLYEWARNWIQEVKLDQDKNLLDIVPFAPEIHFIRPVDVELGPDGRLYVLEWGGDFWGQSRDAQLVRLDYYGASEPPSAPRADAAHTDVEADTDVETGIAIEWPVHGGLFDFGQPIPYRVRVTAQEQDVASSRDVTVQPYLGHDTHRHRLLEHRGMEGTFNIVADSSHKPYIVAHFAEVEAAVAGRAARERIVLFPKQMEAEHFTDAGETDVVITGSRQRPWFADSTEVYLEIEAEGYAAYAPVNLINIDALTLRVAADTSGSVEVRLDAPDGALLSEGQVVPSPSRAGTQENETGPGRRVEAIDWTDVRIPIADPGGAHTLYLVFRSSDERSRLKLDRIEFEGQGVMGRRINRVTRSDH